MNRKHFLTLTATASAFGLAAACGEVDDPPSNSGGTGGDGDTSSGEAGEGVGGREQGGSGGSSTGDSGGGGAGDGNFAGSGAGDAGGAGGAGGASGDEFGGAAGSGGGSACHDLTIRQTDSDGHDHLSADLLDDLATHIEGSLATTAFTLEVNNGGSGDHTHTISLTAEEVEVLRNDGTVTGIVSSDGEGDGFPHTHTYTISCA